ncbi:right-handed parallel beta-helix repeat-containing protein [bacterium]|nr:right-handed parallel beta-helix repeat-containing protein [bacterium]
MKKVLMISLLCITLASLGMAQEQISGPQSGTLGPGTYLVVGDIQVQAGQTLVVEPGTTFLHNGPWSWYVYGQLNADGTEADSIYFVRQNPVPEHRWRSIRFETGASAASTLDYCAIDNCNIPSGSPISMKGGGVYINGVAMTVSNCRISNCDAYWDGGGIYAQNANVIITNNLIVDNAATSGANGGGIVVYNCTEAMITYNEIARNSATGT